MSLLEKDKAVKCYYCPGTLGKHEPGCIFSNLPLQRKGERDGFRPNSDSPVHSGTPVNHNNPAFPSGVPAEKTGAVDIPEFLKKKEAPEAKSSILDEAKRIIYGDREKTYGSPDKNLTLIALLWAEYLDGKYGTAHPLNVDDVCLMMVLLKVARLANDSEHRDSQVDLAGYVALMERVQDFRKERKAE